MMNNRLPVFLLSLFVLLFSCKKEEQLVVDYSEFNVNENVNVQSMFLNGMSGYACGGIKGQSGTIYKTTNGGSSWQRLFSVPGSCLYDVAFVNDTLGFACGENLLLLKTIDGGQTWLDQHSVQGQPPASYTANLRKICCIDENNIFVAGGKDFQTGLTYKTYDGGGFWIYNTFDNELRSAYFKDKYNGYFSGYGAIFHTSDSAHSFSRLPVDNDFFTSVCFIGNTIGYASGYNGGIYKTENGGSSWSEVLKSNTDLNRPHHFNQLKFLNENCGYAVGNNGLITYTEDGGWHWKTIKKITESDLYSICIKDSHSVFITAGEGKIFRLNR